jgi:hypothetical protein
MMATRKVIIIDDEEDDETTRDYIVISSDEEDVVETEDCCRVCWERRANTLVLPCGHVAACTVCQACVDHCVQCQGQVTAVLKDETR